MGSENYALWAVMEEQGRAYDWLARNIDYSLSHVRNIRYGRAKAGPEFRRRCAKLLQIPEGVLFGLYENADVRSVS